MDLKNKILIKISWYVGLIALVGGWVIFLVWTGGRYLSAYDFDNLEIFGFFWMICFFWLCFGALLLLFIYIIINRKNLHWKMLFTGVIILLNIPSVLIILPLQGKLENKVFIKLTNEAGIEKINFQLYGKLKTWEIGTINNNSSKVFNYDPPYWINDARLYQMPDSLSLIINYKETSDTIGFPVLGMGECKQLILDESLKIKPITCGKKIAHN